MARVGAAGWRLTLLEETRSTNDAARGLPPWSAVVARRQTGGRGRFGRVFVSDAGGLWLTAVLPAGGPSAAWLGFSLAVGRHVLRVLDGWKVADARLRWPNDLMSGARKLGGLLIEQGGQATLCVGVGLNLLNEPWRTEPALAGLAARVADCTPLPPPPPEDAAVSVLDAIADAHAGFLDRGMAGAVADLEPLWARGPVTIETVDGVAEHGIFDGLDPDGNVRLATTTGRRVVAHQRVARLVESPRKPTTP